MEKLKAEEEKQMNRIRKPDRRKSQENKGENEATRTVISTAAVPEWNDDSRPDSQNKCINPANRLLLQRFLISDSWPLSCT